MFSLPIAESGLRIAYFLFWRVQLLHKRGRTRWIIALSGLISGILAGAIMAMND
jgi:hypothetical protein